MFVALVLFVKGNISPSQAILISNTMGIMGKGTKEFNAFLQYIQTGVVSAIRVFDLLKEGREEKVVSITDVDLTNEAAVNLENITFSYTDEKSVLNNISLNIKTGATVAFVGDSGSGKSTLLKLIARIYDADTGSVQLFGKSQKELSMMQIQEMCTYVSQIPALIDGSLWENIVLAKPDCTYKEVMDVISLVGLDKYVQMLPDGVNTILGAKGQKVSGGEKQRIAIARALLKDSPIMLFDEITSSLDANTEKELLYNLKNRLVGKTIIMSAHRLYTVQNADKIFVIKDGKVVGEGKHLELLKGNIEYQEICKRMSIQKGESKV